MVPKSSVLYFDESETCAVPDTSFVSMATSQPVTLTTMLGDIAIRGVEAEAVQSVANLCLKVAFLNPMRITLYSIAITP